MLGVKAGERIELLLYGQFHTAQRPFLYARRFLQITSSRQLAVYNFCLPPTANCLLYKKEGIGALYKLCAPSTTPHS